MLCSFLLGTGTGNVNPGNHRIPGSRQTAASATKESSSHKRLRCLENSSFLSSPQCEGDTLHCSDPVATMETVERMFLSQWSLLDTCICALASVLVIDMNWIAAWKPHQLVRLAKHWTSTSAYVILNQHGKICAMLCSFLPGTGIGNMTPGSDRIPGSCHTAASATKESSSHKGWGVCPTKAFSAF